MSPIMLAGIRAREAKLDALRRHEASLRDNPGDYALRGLVVHLRRAILADARVTEGSRR